MKRIEVGRPKIVSIERRMSIASVAQEAGLKPSTIHTRYPEIADEIRQRSGAKDAKKLRTSRKLKDRDRKIATLKRELSEAKMLLSRTASMYASSLSQIATLEQALSSAGKVLPFPRGRRSP
ncbi:hypothetical protein [Pseudoxanthomonas mexicana]|uniref:hypothetical protein n=1 Tax=Pseudoxanthomonas mexicana TaxID=128785 RepID=UPI0012ECDBCB|nr:hypothetical protein [Pseudoxanthomonas mexicana]